MSTFTPSRPRDAPASVEKASEDIKKRYAQIFKV